MQEILQIKNGNITISANGASDYSDTLANFALDSGITLDNINFVMYNRTDKVLIKDNKIVDYVINNTYDNIINDLKNINDKKCNRLNPIKPLTPQEAKGQKLKTLVSDFNSQKDKITTAYATASLLNNQAAMSNIRKEYVTLVTNFAKAKKTI